MGALDYLSDIGTSLAKDLKSYGSGALPTTKAPEAATAPKPSGLGDFVSIPGPKGSKMTLDSTSSEAVLKQMQDFIDKRNDPMAQFNNRLANAQAWTIGDPAQAAAALKGRQELNTQQAKDVQEMQLQIAQFRAAQEQQKLFNQRQAAELYGPGVQGSGGNSEIPPEIKKALSNAMNKTEYDKIFNDWAQDHAKSGGEMVTVRDTNGGEHQVLRRDLPAAIAKYQVVPVGQPTAPAEVPAPTAPSTTAPYGISPKTIAQVESGNKPFAVGPNVPGQGSAKSAMQVMDKTSLDPGFGVTPAQLTGDKDHDESERVRVGNDYFAALSKRYGNDTLAAVAYNMGPGNTDKWIASGANVNKLPPEVRDYVAKAHLTQAMGNKQVAAPAPTAAAAPAAPAATTAAGPDDNAAIQKFIDSIPKPGPYASKEQVDKYNSFVAEQKAKLSVAPIAREQESAQIQSKAAATGSAKREDALADIYHEAPKYLPSLKILKDIASNPDNDKLFAIGNKKDKFSQAFGLGEHLGLKPELMKKDYLKYNPNITTDDLNKIDQYEANAKKVVAAYVHNTFPGRILASELTLGAGAKGVGLDTQRISNLASIALIEGEYTLAEKEFPAFAKYRETHGAAASLDEFERTPEGRAIIESVKKGVMDQYPGIFKPKSKFESFKKPTSGQNKNG